MQNLDSLQKLSWQYPTGLPGRPLRTVFSQELEHGTADPTDFTTAQTPVDDPWVPAIPAAPAASHARPPPRGPPRWVCRSRCSGTGDMVFRLYDGDSDARKLLGTADTYIEGHGFKTFARDIKPAQALSIKYSVKPQ